MIETRNQKEAVPNILIPQRTVIKLFIRNKKQMFVAAVGKQDSFLVKSKEVKKKCIGPNLSNKN